MNIFLLDFDLRKSAEYHCDSHCIKMILEYAQLMSTMHRRFQPNFNPSVYNITHGSHPCTKWLGRSKDNYRMLYEMWVYLCEEYTYRYYKTHKSDRVLRTILSQVPDFLEEIPMTPPALAMPDRCKTDCYVESYRNYYNECKQHLHSWKKRETPDWIIPRSVS